MAAGLKIMVKLFLYIFLFFSNFEIYVGDLSPSTTREELLDHFKDQFRSAISSNLILDPVSKMPKGYGFVQFTNERDADEAIEELNGSTLNGKRIKVNRGAHKRKNDDERRDDRGGRDQGRDHGRSKY